MKPPGVTYLVGGAVRDQLLGRQQGDRDYVVVGSTPEAMVAAGFQPVGEHFPVFLHPKTKEEYALARCERKSGHGYRGFTFFADESVTLQDDLKRRDLTINAMAMDDNGEIIDPYGGRDDLASKTLRHVSDAFAEDPVRVLRVARFAARLPDFTIANSTQKLMRQMVTNGETNHLQRERVWQELARGLCEPKPSKMVEALAGCGALQAILPEVAALKDIPERLDYHPEGNTYIHTLMVVDAAAARGQSLGERFAALLHDIGKAQTPAEILPSHHGHEKRSAVLVRQLCERMQPPHKAAELAELAAGEHGNVHQVFDMRIPKVVDLLTRTDSYRRRDRFESLLRVCEADFYYLPERQARGEVYQQAVYLRAAADTTAAVPAGAVAAEVRAKGKPTTAIPTAIRTARIRALRTSNELKQLVPAKQK